MRKSDLVRLAWKTLKGRWAVLPVISLAIASFCLCFAGTILVSVQHKKMQPYEIVVTGQTDKILKDSDVAVLSEIEDVTAISAIIELPVTLTTGNKSIELVLTGMNNGYINGTYTQGNAFPANTVMPYIVLNQAACTTFTNIDNSSMAENQDVNWLSTAFTVQLEEGNKPITARICGILADYEGGGQEPAAYISLSAAKELQQLDQQKAGYNFIYVRLKNIGCADSVSKTISELGLIVNNSTDSLQIDWGADIKEMTYLLVIGSLCITFASILQTAWMKLSRHKQDDAWNALLYFGMREQELQALFIIQAVFISFLGIGAGVLTALSLPSFLSVEWGQDSTFLLPIPLTVIVVTTFICLGAGLLPFFKRHIRKSK